MKNARELYQIYLLTAFHRAKLEKLAAELGRDNPLVLAQSRRVDRLMVELQKRRLAG